MMTGERIFTIVWWLFWAIVFRGSLVSLFIAPIVAWHASVLFCDWYNKRRPNEAGEPTCSD